MFYNEKLEFVGVVNVCCRCSILRNKIRGKLFESYNLVIPILTEKPLFKKEKSVQFLKRPKVSVRFQFPVGLYLRNMCFNVRKKKYHSNRILLRIDMQRAVLNNFGTRSKFSKKLDFVADHC